MSFRRRQQSGRFPWDRSEQRFRQAEFEMRGEEDARRARPGERGFGWARRRDIDDVRSQEAAPHGPGRYDPSGEEHYAEALDEFERGGYRGGRPHQRWELDEGGVEFGRARWRGGQAQYGRRGGYSGEEAHFSGLRGRGGEYDERSSMRDFMRGQFGRGEFEGPSSGRFEGPGGYRGRGPRGYQRSDDRIREDVCDRLTDDDEIDASDIDVRVESGCVTLAGTVEHRDAKRRAEDVAESIAGVREVQNNLRVQQQGWFGSPEQQSSRPRADTGHPAGGQGAAAGTASHSAAGGQRDISKEPGRTPPDGTPSQ